MGPSSRPRNRLSTTPNQADLDALELGDIVYLDGLVYTAREGVYMRARWMRARRSPSTCLPQRGELPLFARRKYRDDGGFNLGAVTATASFRCQMAAALDREPARS